MSTRSADATLAARVYTRLDYLLCANRFGHYFRCLYRDVFGSTGTPAQWEAYCNEWVSQYVSAEPKKTLTSTQKRAAH